MPLHKYDILLTAAIEIGGSYEADTAEQAIAQAKLELREQGEISSIEVERQVLIDDDFNPQLEEPLGNLSA